MKTTIILSALLASTLLGSSKAYFEEDTLDGLDVLRLRRLRPRFCDPGLGRTGEECDSWTECCSEICRRGQCWSAPQPRRCPGEPRKIMGRPFRVDGDTVSAPLTCQDTGDQRIEVWKESAVGEHASVASFADLSLKLFTLGAPMDILEKAASAQLDEVRHANLMLGLIRTANPDEKELKFGAVNLRKVNSSVFDTSYEKIMLESLEDGCMNEGIAAGIAAEVAKVVKESHVKTVYETIATDEHRHAMLAWDIVEWVLSEKPELAETAKTSYEKFAEATEKAGAASFPGSKLTTKEAAARAVSETLRTNRERLSKILEKTTA